MPSVQLLSPDGIMAFSALFPIILWLLFLVFKYYRAYTQTQAELYDLQQKQKQYNLLTTREGTDKQRSTDIAISSPLDDTNTDEKATTTTTTATTTTNKNLKNKLNKHHTPFQHDHEDPESIFKNIRPIAYVNAPFSRRALIPRQSQMADIRSELKFRKEVQPQFSLEGITEYNYAWVIFSFHANTNIGTEKRFIKTLINPPRSPDKRYGIYATRTPHRHNNIGLSLAKIVSWDKNKGILVCSGLDLLDGTPILDIKPVHPCEQEILSTEQLLYPSFVQANHTHTVEWEDAAVDKLTNFVQTKRLKSYPYPNIDNFRSVLDDILTKQDPRSSWHKGKEHNMFTVELYHTYIDLLFENNVITIKDVNLMPNDVVKQNKEQLHSLQAL